MYILELFTIVFAILIFFVIIFVVSIVFSLSYTSKKYERFVLEHSQALKQLTAINQAYNFKNVDSLDMCHYYDNENFYYEISPTDYLTYQLVYIKKDVRQAILNARENKKAFDAYSAEISKKCKFNSYDITPLPNLKKLSKIEKRLFDLRIKKTITELRIRVELYRTNINGIIYSSKQQFFTEPEIESIIGRLNLKNGDFYLDYEIWQAICRVERGKVTNKMRFAIYERDGHRCRKCGKTTDLEIDHIYPISKGGKSNFENLQTLCHRCNALKSNTVEYETKNFQGKR